MYTSGSGEMKDNIVNIFGSRILQDLEIVGKVDPTEKDEFDLENERVEGETNESKNETKDEDGGEDQKLKRNHIKYVQNVV